MTVDVIGLGFAAMDLFLNTENLPREDGFSFVYEERLLPGGSCANALVAVCRMGGSAGLIAQMGDDHYGRLFTQDLEQTGVSSAFVLTKPQGISLHNFITVTAKGAKAIYSHLGNSLLALSEDEVSPRMIAGARVFYTELVPAKPALKLARACKAAGIPIVFNLQVGPGFMALCGVPHNRIDEMLKNCDLFITNHHFMCELAEGDDCRQAAASVYERYQPSIGVIATMGADGACFLIDGESIVVPAFNIRAVDTTGAGDAFSGGLLYARFIKGLSVQESMIFATGCAAVKCTQPGPRLNANETDILRFIGDAGQM